MNTSSKRFSKAASLIVSYLVVLIVAVFLSSFLMNRDKIGCNPTISASSNSSVVFIPNLDITDQMNYNVKEAYIYLVHQTEVNGIRVEQTIWSTLAKKNKQYVLNSKELGISSDRTRPLTKGHFLLKGSYFPYIGVIKNTTFAEFSARIS